MGMKANSPYFPVGGVAGGPSVRLGDIRFRLDIQLFAQMPKNPSQTHHILADRPGHLPESEENRRILVDLSNEQSNYVGKSVFGNDVYVKEMGNLQYWVLVRNGIIQDGGANKPGQFYAIHDLLFGRKKR